MSLSTIVLAIVGTIILGAAFGFYWFLKGEEEYYREFEDEDISGEGDFVFLKKIAFCGALIGVVSLAVAITEVIK